MQYFFRPLLAILCLFTAFSAPLHSQSYTIVIHGGAGSIEKEGMSEEKRLAYTQKMIEALKAGEQILVEMGSAEDAVVAAIGILEDSPLFNAGRGAVMTWDTLCELDASIMRGADLQAGAVAGISRVKSPIRAAQLVMNNSSHVMLSGKGAEEFAASRQLTMVEPSYFETAESRERLEKFMRKRQSGALTDSVPDWKYGTVGCVALDRKGNLAAGTSTGGMTGKRYGRIGDSPLIGAGTYADNDGVAVSCTGHGEFFIRYAVAYDLNALVKYSDHDLPSAADSIILRKLAGVGGAGGLIALDKEGTLAMPFNTPGMFRAYKREGEEAVVKMFKD